ncbi:MAG: tetratricopeptide repeat protein [Myxococcota bacterium]|jgi:hypothetical protein|nr:tetratricopeptide repeat protein [Myxococcota bacterium]
MRNVMLLVATLLLGAFVSPFVSDASAQDARELFQRGRGAYETGDFEGAVAAWQAAYELDPRPLLQFNLAQAYERLGRLQESLEAYERFLAAAPSDADDVPAARIRAAAIQQRLARTGIVLRGGPDGAVVLIDGTERARLPRPDPIAVPPGSYRVLVHAEGYQPFESVVAVTAGAQVEVTVQMSDQVVPDPTTPEESGGVSTIGIAVAAGGGALLVGGAVTGILALGAAGDATTSEDSDADRARTLGLVTDILLGVGAAAALTGVVLMFVLGGDEDRATAVAPMIGPDRVGVGAIHRF